MSQGCPTCRKKFETQRGVRVHHWRSHGERLPNRTCAACETQFHSEHERKYCSSDCRNSSVSRAGVNNPNYRGTAETSHCKNCDSEFTYYPSAKPGVYCGTCVDSTDWQSPPTLERSANPRWSGGKQDYPCAVCSTTVKRYPSQVTSAAICSEPCRKDWLSEHFTGENHPNWKGGSSPNYGTGWRSTRARALERDGYQCVICNQSADELGRNPDVHHIVPVRRFADSRDYSVSDAHFLRNVVSLCSSCHRRAEFGTIPREELLEHVSPT